MYRLIQLCFICVLLALQIQTQKVHAQEVASNFPKDLQLYPRDLTNNQAIVTLSGTIDASIYSQISIEVFREGEIWFNVRQAISDEQNSYYYEVAIQAELAEYDFHLYGIMYNGERTLLKLAERVVSGDAFLIYGQSNAVGTGSSNEPGIKVDRHPFSRTFGSTVRDETVVEYPYWYEAITRLAYTKGSTSVWAGRLCFRIIEVQGVPCATINGAYPGEVASFFLPNVENRSDLTTAYGRLLWRSKESGLQNAYRGIFWYQGESDGRNANIYKESMDHLFAHWSEDFPSLEQYFILQVRYGCGTLDHDNMVFEIQRQFQNRPSTTIIPTNGIGWYDGCHYHAPGYEILADQLYYPVITKIYGANSILNMYAPDISSAKQVSPKEIEVTLDIHEGDELITEEGFHIDFAIVQDNGQEVTPIDGVLAGNIITLTLRRETVLYNADLGYVAGKTYLDLGLEINSSPRIMNLNGIHLLNFWDEPIESTVRPTKIGLQLTAMKQSRSFLFMNLLVSGSLVCLTGHTLYRCKDNQ